MVVDVMERLNEDGLVCRTNRLSAKTDVGGVVLVVDDGGANGLELDRVNDEDDLGGGRREMDCCVDGGGGEEEGTVEGMGLEGLMFDTVNENGPGENRMTGSDEEMAEDGRRGSAVEEWEEEEEKKGRSSVGEVEGGEEEEEMDDELAG